MTALVAAARRYEGVKFVHRGRQRDKLDCAGLVIRAYADCGVHIPEPPLYGQEPQEGAFMNAIVGALGPAVPGPPQIGDVVTMRTKLHPHHLAIVSDHPDHPLGLIHASGEHGCVVRHGLDRHYQRRIVTIHRRPV